MGILSDVFAGSMGDALGIRWSLIIFVLLGIPCAAMFWAARKNMREDMVS